MEIPMTFWKFGENLLEKMLIYNPIHRLYPSDERTRTSVVKNQDHRRNQGMPSEDIPENGLITKSDLKITT